MSKTERNARKGIYPEAKGKRPIGACTQQPENLEPYINITEIKPDYCITISKDDKSLTLDFNTGKLIVKGNMPYDKASEMFFNVLNQFFSGNFISRKEVKEAIENMKFYNVKGCFTTDTEETKKNLLRELKL